MPNLKKKKPVSDSDDSDSGPDDRNPPPPSKKSKDSEKPTKPDTKKNNGGGGGGDDGTNIWTLERLRQVRINEFRGRKMVDIREFYEKNGDILPGKKGISLSALQWRKLLEHADEITKALEQ